MTTIYLQKQRYAITGKNDITVEFAKEQVKKPRNLTIKKHGK